MAALRKLLAEIPDSDLPMAIMVLQERAKALATARVVKRRKVQVSTVLARAKAGRDGRLHLSARDGKLLERVVEERG